MKLRPEVVRFLEAQAHLTMAAARRASAEAEYRDADALMRRAWDALTPAEVEMVNAACAALEEPKAVRR